MKKRVLTLILAAILCASTALALTSCGDHTFKEEWAKDATHHWHACEDEGCTEVSDKAEHTWNNGEETTFATETENGVMTYTCTVCKQTKTAETIFDGVNITQYGMAVDSTTLQNVTVAVKLTSGSQVQESILRLNGNEYSLTAKDGTPISSGESAEEAASLRNEYLFFSIVDEISGTTKVTHKDLTYDAASKTYSTSAEFTVTVEDAEEDTVTTFKSIVMTISGTRIQTVATDFEIKYGDELLSSGKLELALSEYNTTEVTVIPDNSGDEDPEAPENPSGPQGPEDFEENPEEDPEDPNNPGGGEPEDPEDPEYPEDPEDPEYPEDPEDPEL